MLARENVGVKIDFLQQTQVFWLSRPDALEKTIMESSEGSIRFSSR